MADQADKRPPWRPSKYDPAFCDRVEDFMALGFSKMAAAGDLGVCYNTLKAWMDEHPDFLTAVKRGEARRVVKLERDLLDAEAGPKVTSRIFALKNAAPDEWKDKQTLSGDPENPLNVTAIALVAPRS